MIPDCIYLASENFIHNVSMLSNHSLIGTLVKTSGSFVFTLTSEIDNMDDSKYEQIIHNIRSNYLHQVGGDHLFIILENVKISIVLEKEKF